ncbi:membrane hypothetical protein [Gammaproteobacteria bacterium]
MLFGGKLKFYRNLCFSWILTNFLEILLVPSRLVKKTSLIMLFILGAMISGQSVMGADALQSDNSLLFAPIPPVLNVIDNDSAKLFTPMSDGAMQGMGCFLATTAGLATAYVMGPTELMMLVTGAVIVPSKSSLLFIALGGILGAGTCSLGASLAPSVLWANENFKGISERIHEGIKTTFKPKIEHGKTDTNYITSEIRPMNKGEIQGAGCLLGFLGIGAVALATAPTEAVMLAAGGVGVPSSTSLLMMGMLGTLLPAGCSLGSAFSLPVVELYQNFDKAVIGQKFASLKRALHEDVEKLKSANQNSFIKPEIGTAMRVVQKEIE